MIDLAATLEKDLAKALSELRSSKAFEESYRLHNIAMNSQVIAQRALIATLREDIARLEAEKTQ